MSRPLSVSSVVYDGYGIDFAIGDLAALGVHRVEPAYIRGYVDFDETAFADAAARRLRGVLAAAGVEAQAVSAHIDLGAEGAADQLRRRIAFCRGIGAGILISNSTEAGREAALLATIEAALPLLEAADVVLALENPGHGRASLLPGGHAFAGLLDRFGSERVRANYDIGNSFTYNGETLEPLADLDAALPFAAHIHAKDVRSDAGGWSFTAIGEGSVGYAAIARRLAAQAPGLPVGIELPLRLDRSGRRDPERRREPLPLDAIRAAIRRSVAFLTAAGDGPA